MDTEPPGRAHVGTLLTQGPLLQLTTAALQKQPLHGWFLHPCLSSALGPLTSLWRVGVSSSDN